jgi:hypothetical protein
MNGLDITFEQAVEAWTLLNLHILRKHSLSGEWLFLHYDQVLWGDGLDRLEKLTGAKSVPSFKDETLRHSSSEAQVSSLAMAVYEELCCLAEYKG